MLIQKIRGATVLWPENNCPAVFLIQISITVALKKMTSVTTFGD
jgi:hypothetical protein